MKKLVIEMMANELVKLSSITDFDKDKLNILLKGESNYNVYLILNKNLYAYIINAKVPVIYNSG